MALRSMLTASFLCACSVLALTARLSAEDQMPWVEDFGVACQQASAQGKLVLIHFYSDDCPPCVRVEKNVFSQAEVGAVVGKACVPVKVHARQNPALVAKYHVQAWPTDVFVTPAGLEVTRTISPKAPADYISMVTTVATTVGAGLPRSNANGVISQVSTQVAAQSNYMASTAAQSAQQIQSSAQQAQQAAQQAAQQQWQNSQAQANQYANNAQQAAQQFTNNAQQQTQVAADHAKEVINRYSQPFQQAAATGWQPPAFASPASPAPSSPPPTQAATQATVQQHYAQPAPPAVQPQLPVQQTAQSQPPQPAAGSATVMAGGTYPVAMEGYCPVTLATEKKWKKGQQQFGAVHRRRTFLFNSAAEQQKFLADPDRYSPVLVGYDPVKYMQSGELVDGRANYSLTYKKQVYLFNDDNALKLFWQNPSQFTDGLRQAMMQAENKIR